LRCGSARRCFTRRNGWTPRDTIVLRQMGETMNNVNLPHPSRRRFIAAAGLGATAAFVARLLFAQTKASFQR
jgi:hypothetical protein